MNEANYLKQWKGFRSKGLRRATRVAPSSRLLDLFGNSEPDSFKVALVATSEYIMLKDSEKNLVDYSESGATVEMRKNLMRLNSTLNIDNQLSLDGQLVDAHLKRVFNDRSFSAGGRLYGRYQNLPQNDRCRLEINGQKTVERDYSSLHPKILYAKVGIVGPMDPYLPNGFKKSDRAVFKDIFLILLNCKSEKSLVPACLASFRGGNCGIGSKKELMPYLDALILHNDGIKEYFCSQAAKKLQFEDSEMAVEITKYFMELGIPVYPVHDSFIVEEKFEAKLVKKMKQVFDAKYKAPIEVKTNR